MHARARTQKVTAGAVVVLMIALACLAVTRFINLSNSKPDIKQSPQNQDYDGPKPDLSTLAPGAWTAIRRRSAIAAPRV